MTNSRRLRLLVTGATGRVGSQVVARLVRAGHSVVAMSRRSDPVAGAEATLMCDLLDFTAVDQAVAQVRPNAVVHIAALATPRLATAEALFRTNTLSTFNLAESAAAYGVDRFVYASSGATFGFAYCSRPLLPIYLPLDEAHPRCPQDPYSLSKLIGEEIVAAYARRTGATAASLIFPFVVGPAEWPTRGRTALFDPPPNSIFSYVDARDLARAFQLAVEADWEGHEVFVIAAADALAMEPLAELVPRRYPGTAQIAAELTSGSPFMSSAKAGVFLGWEGQHSWRDELEDLAARWPASAPESDHGHEA